MLKIKSLTLKNFMSFGNVEQNLSFDENILTLILGENRDISNINHTADEKNGTGKSVICSALSYVLTDKPIGNIRKDKLINNINEKDMSVTVEFEKNGINYKIIRGRKPNILKLYINDEDFESQQGEVRDTQDEITDIIGMSHELLNMVVIMNGTELPFAQKKLAEQRTVIEELLRITQLSEKSEAIKEHIKVLSKQIEMEEFKVKTIKEMNHKTISQLDRLEKMSLRWNKDHDENIENLTETLETLSNIDIENELIIHELIDEIMTVNTAIQKLEGEQKRLNKAKSDISAKISRKQDHLDKALVDKECYACGQAIDENHGDMIETVKSDIQKLDDELTIIQNDIDTIVNDLSEKYDIVKEIPDVGTPFYESQREAWAHDDSIKTLTNELERELKKNNPYDEQVSSIREESLQEVDTTLIEDLDKERQHYEFLHKVLTGKDSFVRKKIIDQSIKFLNSRLKDYIEEIGLPHKVKFESDMSITIEKMGKFYDYDNLSRGQKTRLNLALSFSFRDVFENLHFPINTLMVDEVIDNGLDGAGVDNAIKIMKNISREQNKSVYLISHKEEAKPKANKIMTVVFENSFSSFN